jgi:hypothetical protein
LCRKRKTRKNTSKSWFPKEAPQPTENVGPSSQPTEDVGPSSDLVQDVGSSSPPVQDISPSPSTHPRQKVVCKLTLRKKNRV